MRLPLAAAPGGILACLLASTGVSGPSPYFWTPPRAGGQLEVLGPLGGWSQEGAPAPRVRWAVPGDPKPARPAGMDRWEYWQQERQAQEAAVLQRVKDRLPDEPESNWALIRLLDWAAGEAQAPDRPVAPPATLAFLARYTAARTQVEQELQEAEQARHRELRIWFNGRAETLRVEANEAVPLHLEPWAGENRLEVLDPATGQREVRSWWRSAAAGPRLQVRVEGYESVKVLEPGGKLAEATRHYRRANPPPGTYAVLWAGYRATQTRWWSPEDAAPVTLKVDVLVDAGTDRERRIHFEKLCFPGGGEKAVGTFHVED